MSHLENAADAVERLVKEFRTMKLSDKVDVAARAKAIVKNLEEIDSLAKIDIKAKRKGDAWLVLGKLFQAKGVVVTTERLDQKKLKESYPDVYADCLSKTESERITYEIR